MKNEINVELNENFEFVEINFDLNDVTFVIHYTQRLDKGGAPTAVVPIEKSVPESFIRNSMHTHPFCEMFVAENTEFDLNFNGETVRVHAGDAVIVPIGTKHCASSDGQSKALCIIFSYTQNALYKPNGLYDTLSALFAAPYVYVNGSFAEKVIEFYRYLNEYNVIMASSCFFDIIADAICKNAKMPRRETSDMMTDSEISRARRIMNLINTYYMQDISLDFLAKSLNLSVRHTSRIIKSQLGKTLGEIVLEKRMEAAEGLLINSSLTVSEIAARIGYNSISCFYTAFKNYYGALPKEYKKQYLPEKI